MQKANGILAKHHSLWYVKGAHFNTREDIVRNRAKALFAIYFVLAFHTIASSQEPIPFVPTPIPVVDRMLELAEVQKNDLIYDLGSGDGRILIQAAKKYGSRGVGVDLDPKMVEMAQTKAKEEGVSHLVEFRAGDGLQVDVSDATVVTLYMFKWFNNEMRPKLQRLRPGARVVAHDFDIDDWKPTKIVSVHPDAQAGIDREHTLFLWKLDGSLPPP
jgi:SAM-dependent methyltransferase